MIFTEQFPAAQIVQTLGWGQRYSRTALTNIIWQSLFNPDYANNRKPITEHQLQKRHSHINRQIGRMVHHGLLKEMPDGTFMRVEPPDYEGEKVTFHFRGVQHQCARRDYERTVENLRAATPEAIEQARIESMEKALADLKKEVHQ